jgi:hypothetical protein
MSLSIRSGLMPWLLAFMAIMIVAGCSKEQPPGPSDVLARTRVELAKADFGKEFEKCMAVLVTLPEQTDDKAVIFGARLARAQALLELSFAAQLTGSEALTEQLKMALGLQLDGGLLLPRNYQIVAQTLLEEFRFVARETAGSPKLQKQAEALAKYTVGLQGILFRAKADYFRGRDAVSAIPELAYFDHLSAVRDLIVETLDRTDGPDGNWQNIVLTVIGRVCPRAAARYLMQLCTATDLTTESEEFCHPDFRKIPAGRQAQGHGLLAHTCAPQEVQDGSLLGLAAVKAYYDPAFQSLLADDSGLRPTLRQAVQKMANRREVAYEALSVFVE